MSVARSPTVGAGGGGEASVREEEFETIVWRPYLGTESVKQQLSTFRGHVINVSWQKQTLKHRLKGLTEAQ